MADATPFEFEPIDDSFDGFASRDVRNKLEQWGVKGSSLHKFHFNLRCRKNQVKALLDDFLSNPAVLKTLPAKVADAEALKGKAEWTQLNTSVVRLEFFDRLEEAELVNQAGMIKRMMDEVYDGVTCSDYVRDLLLNPDSEYLDLYSEDDKKEFIYHIFKWLCVGGSMSQPDDVIRPYVDTTKALYRELVKVHKAAATGNIEVSSLVFQLSSLGDNEAALFEKASMHNICYLIVDLNMRSVTTWHHEFKSYW